MHIPSSHPITSARPFVRHLLGLARELHLFNSDRDSPIRMPSIHLFQHEIQHDPRARYIGRMDRIRQPHKALAHRLANLPIIHRIKPFLGRYPSIHRRQLRDAGTVKQSREQVGFRYVWRAGQVEPQFLCCARETFCPYTLAGAPYAQLGSIDRDRPMLEVRG